MDYNQACEVAGRIFGNILCRDADKAGFDYAVHQLTNGTPPIKICLEIMESEEFAQKFLINQTPYNISSKITEALCGWKQSSQDAVNGAVHICRKGYKSFLQSTVDQGLIALGKNHVPDLRRFFD